MDSEGDTSDPLSPLSSSSSIFDRDLHVTSLEMMYQLLPSEYQSQEINSLTLAYFVLSGLDLLGALDRIDKDEVANWVLSFRIQPKDKSEIHNGRFYGFCGSRSSQFSADNNWVLIHDGGHLASTYCALAILKIVGYDLSSIDSELIVSSMRNLQQPDGSFMPVHAGAEADLRFVYCAAAICFMFGDWSGMDREKAKKYILSCQSYDGGFGLVPCSESHGGGTYCAVASLKLLGFIEDDIVSRDCTSSIINLQSLLNWCLNRQASDGGFQGRSNKASDTCYAFWIGSVLKILGGDKFIDRNALREFLFSCQSKYGGFSKFPREFPDLYHSYYGLCAFSLLDQPNTNPLCVELGITEAAAARLSPTGLSFYGSKWFEDGRSQNSTLQSVVYLC